MNSLKARRADNVAALAGRRVDAIDADTSRFPLAQVKRVRKDVENLFRREGVGVLVCSASCGADLIGLEVATSLGMRCRIVLPYDRSSFRLSSVVDRPGNWGPIYDRIIAKIDAVGDLEELSGVVGNDLSYRNVNEAIVSVASLLARPARALAVVVWDGQSSNERDWTEHFRVLATAAGMRERQISTCCG